jgi:hypothetical protein
MKKVILLLSGLFILTACQNDKDTTDTTWDSFVEKYQKKEDNMTENIKKINLEEYSFLIPKVYDASLVKDSKNMEKYLFDKKELDIHDSPVSTVLYGGIYNSDKNIFITLMYLVNNTDREIEDISFNYDLDLTTIGGENEGNFPTAIKRSVQNLSLQKLWFLSS